MTSDATPRLAERRVTLRCRSFSSATQDALNVVGITCEDTYTFAALSASHCVSFAGAQALATSQMLFVRYIYNQRAGDVYARLECR